MKQKFDISDFFGATPKQLLCNVILIRTGSFASSHIKVAPSSSFEVWLDLNNQPFVHC